MPVTDDLLIGMAGAGGDGVISAGEAEPGDGCRANPARLGAEPLIMYRRTRNEMPAHDFEADAGSQVPAPAASVNQQARGG